VPRPAEQFAPRILFPFEIALKHDTSATRDDDAVQIPDTFVGNELVKSSFETRKVGNARRNGLPVERTRRSSSGERAHERRTGTSQHRATVERRNLDTHYGKLLLQRPHLIRR